jgi:hypothetical protein
MSRAKRAKAAKITGLSFRSLRPYSGQAPGEIFLQIPGGSLGMTGLACHLPFLASFD